MSIVKIAHHAGVSTATVSRVFSNYPHVRAETAQKVRASAEALNCTVPASPKRTRNPDFQRTRQSRRRTNSIAILTLGETRAWLQLPVMAATVAGITLGAREHDLRLMLDEQPNLARQSKVIMNHRVDGAIVFMPSSIKGAMARETLALIKKHMPVVWIMGAGVGVTGVDHLSADNHAIGLVALEYLKDRACQDVAFLTMNPNWNLFRERGQSFAAAAYENNLPSSSYLLSLDPAIADLYGRRAVVEKNLESLIARLVQSKPRPTGLFISNDAVTVQVYALLQQAGVIPGRDITIVSCDNEEIRLSNLVPRPASIDIGAEEIGRRAVRRLVNRIMRVDDPTILINVAPRLVIS